MRPRIHDPPRVHRRTDGIDDFAMVSAARVGFGAYSVSGSACVIRRERSDKESKGIAAYGHPAGTPGAGGVERLLPRENGQRLGGGEFVETVGIVRRNRLVR